MNNRYGYKNLLASMLLSGSMMLVTYSGLANTGDDQLNTVQHKTGYEVDGRTSASVIAAKRSHAVTEQDKIGLGVYSGIFVIGLIVFFAQILNEKK